MTMPAVISREALPAYQYVSPDINDMVALGIQTPILYNGLILNDRLRPDRYRVTEIDGLGSPDIRDNREPLPADHGEVPYDAYWAGDTLTIDGTMDAGNVFELARMERDLRAAFSTLVETPMKFNWWDIHDEFSDAQTSAAMWGALDGTAAFPGDGTMLFSTGPDDAALLYYALRQYVDHTITQKFVLAPITNGSLPAPTVGVIAKCSDSATYLLAYATASELSIEASLAGVPVAIASTSFDLASSTQYWLQLQIIGDAVTATVYQTDPLLGPGTALVSLSEQLTGAVADQLGFMQQGFAGIAAGGQNIGQTVVMDYRVDAIWPCDMVLNVRPIASPVVKNIVQPVATSVSHFRRDFQVTVRASNPRITQPTMQSASTIPLTSATSPALGRIYSRSYPLAYRTPTNAFGQSVLIGASAAPIVQCVNRGNWLAQPIITFFGGVSYPYLVNEEGDYMLLDGTIALGDFVIVNVASGTLTNSSGSDVFGLWDPSSVWLTVPPGPSRFLLSGRQPVGSPYVTMAWANTWK